MTLPRRMAACLIRPMTLGPMAATVGAITGSESGNPPISSWLRGGG